MKKGKFFIIEVPLYNFRLGVSIEQTDQQCLLSCAKLINLDESMMEAIYRPFEKAHSIGRVTYLLEVGPYLLRLKNTPTTAEGAGTLTHEMFHVVYSLLDNRGMKLSRNSEEAYSYLQGWLIKQVYSRLIK